MFCFIDYAKAFDHVDHNKLGKFLKKWEYQTILPVSWEASLQNKKQQLEPDMEPRTDSKFGKDYVKAVYCHLAYLTYVQVIMRNARLDEAEAGIKIVRRNIYNHNYADYTQITPPLWQKVKRN